MSKTLLRLKDVESTYRVSRNTLMRWEEKGQLKDIVSRTSGGHRRYDKDALEDFLEYNSSDQGVDRSVVEQHTMTKEIGTTGVPSRWTWWQSPYSEQLRVLRGHAGRRLLREMRINDPVIAAVFLGIENALRQAQASKRIEPASDLPADREFAEFVETCFDDMSWSWEEQFTLAISPTLEQGFEFLEVVMKRRLGPNPPEYTANPAPSQYDDGYIGWRKWSPRPALSLLENHEIIWDNHGGIKGINQQTGWGSTLSIPIQKLLHFRTTPHPANNPFGISIHRAAYMPYYFGSNIMELEGIAYERNIAGLPIIYLGQGTTKSGPNSDYSLAVDIVNSIRMDEQGGIVVPHQKMDNNGKGILIELLSNTSRTQFNSIEMIERYNRLKALTTLSQFLLLGMGQRSGSFAMSKHQGDIFALAISAFLHTFADVINRHAIPKLASANKANFPNITGLPKYVPGPIGLVDLNDLSGFVNNLVNAEVLQPDEKLERELRQVARLPQKAVEINTETSE